MDAFYSIVKVQGHCGRGFPIEDVSIINSQTSHNRNISYGCFL